MTSTRMIGRNSRSWVSYWGYRVRRAAIAAERSSATPSPDPALPPAPPSPGPPAGVNSDALPWMRSQASFAQSSSQRSTSSVTCGRASIAFVWMHDLWDFIQAKVLFRI